MAVRLSLRKTQASDASKGEAPFILRPRTATYWSFSLFLAASAGLAVSLVTDDGTDLATVALILAIIAFGLQIIFFAGQLWVAKEQDRRSGELYTETAALLTEISSSASETVGIIKEQFRFVLEHALAVRDGKHPIALTPPGSDSRDQQTAEVSSSRSETEPEASPVETRDPESDSDGSGSDTSSDADVANLAEKLAALEAKIGRPSEDLVRQWEEIAAGAGLRTSPSPGADLVARPSLFETQRQARIRREMNAWPRADLGPPALEALLGLEPEVLERFKWLARRWLRASKGGKQYSGYMVNDTSHIDKLAEAGLVEPYRTRQEDGRFSDAVRWSELGKAAAQLFTAVGEAPAWTRDSIDHLESLGSLETDPPEKS